MGSVANFIRFPVMQKGDENRLRFDKVTESIKVGTFLRHNVHCEPIKNTKMFLSYLPQNSVDSDKIWYTLS